VNGNVHHRRLTLTGPHRRPALTRPQPRLDPDNPAPPAPYTGPPTEAQLVALRNLQAIATQQSSPVPDELIELSGEEERSARDGFPWQLVVVLVAQAALSLRLVWSNTAFMDEALYVWTGHMEWAHWLQGAPVPAFQSWFSGAPVLYPALAALVDTYGGLPAVRLLSLALMLCITCFLWGTASRLVNRRAALIAAALFAALAGAAFLGAFATYDAMALFLITGATWIAVRAGRRGPLASLVFLLAGLILGLACAVKYAAALFVPVVVLVVLLSRAREASWRRGFAAAATVSAAWLATVAAGLIAGGADYWHGLQVTTLSRQAATSSPLSVLKLSYIWTDFIVVLAAVALLVSRREPPAYRWLLRVLAVTAFLVPAEQARIYTTVSLHKHVVFGAWFASMAAAYVLGRLSLVDKTRGWMIVISIPIIASTLLQAMPQASALYGKWPDMSALAAVMPKVAAQHPGAYLADPDVLQVVGYYGRGQTGWTQWADDLTYHEPGITPGLPSIRVAIANHRFALVVTGTTGTTFPPVDKAILADIKQSGGYRIVASADGYEVWTPAEKP
jgi:4-amino-4-deoxy-L-arabinose transferase-like glycosyltransferase